MCGTVGDSRVSRSTGGRPPGQASRGDKPGRHDAEVSGARFRSSDHDGHSGWSGDGSDETHDDPWTAHVDWRTFDATATHQYAPRYVR